MMDCKRRPRVLHYVYGGGTGSCRRVVDLCKVHQASGEYPPVLVFRGRPYDLDIPEQMRELGLAFHTVDSGQPLAIIGKLVRIIRLLRPAVVVGHGYREHLHARIAGLVTRVPILIQVERNIEQYSARSYWMSRVLERYTWRILCVSYAVKSALAEAGFSERKLMVVYNGLNLSALRPPAGQEFSVRENKVVMVGRFGRQKDHETLIRAFRAVLESDPGARLELVGGADGDGRALRRMSDLVRELKIEHAIRFVGKSEQVPQILWQSRVFVMSTHFEGLCGSLIEAMAAGCAVVGSNVAGVSELIEHGHTGLLVRENDVADLAAKIGELLERPEYASALAANARRFAEANFSLSMMADRYAECFREALEETNGRFRNTA